MGTDVEENISLCQLLLEAVAKEPEIFMDVIGQQDYSAEVVSEYFSGLLEIVRLT